MGRTCVQWSFFLLLCTIPVHASVILNEVVIQPTQTVEIINTDATRSADISSWYIDDSGGSTYFSIPINTFLPPLSCLVFSGDFNLNKSSPDIIRLFTNATPPTSSSAILVDSYSYPKAPENGYSFARNPYGEWNINTSTLGLTNDTLLTCLPSPTPTLEPTTIPTPTVTIEPTVTSTPSVTPTQTVLLDYDNIYLSEIHPFPQTGTTEWVELYNANDISVNLIDWYIDDGENTGGAPKRFSLALDPYEYGAVDISSSLLNNTGDTVRLLNAQKIEKQSVEFGKIKQGNSMGRENFDDDIYCEQHSTKNEKNTECISSSVDISPTPKPLPTKKISIQKIVTQKIQINKQTSNSDNSVKTIDIQPVSEGVVLGVANQASPSPVPYLSGVSVSYSVLTIVSLFIKMRNA
ncbi:MAG: hypothetical protein WAV30_03395 [Microgenomates group bacterium]